MNKEIEEMKNAQKSIFAYLIIFYVGAAVVSFLLRGMFKTITLENVSLYNSSVNFVVYVILITTLVFINFKSLKADFKALKFPKILLTILSYYLLAYVLNMVGNMLILGVSNNANLVNFMLRNGKLINSVSDNQNFIVEILHSKGAIMMILSAGIFGPVCEELVFRKAIFSLTKKPELGILVSSFLFGLIHVLTSMGHYSFIEMLLMFTPYVVSGLAFSLIYIHSNYNIYSTIFTHMLMNIISMVMIYLV